MPKSVVAWLNISLDSVTKLREENAALKAANSQMETELVSTKVNLDWLRVQYNQVQLERAELMHKVNGIRVPVPELTRATRTPRGPSLEEFSFEDIGDEVASKLGLPRYDLPSN
jgi:hypothetical protein